jgi:O-antigen biosynthesis protein
LEAAPLMLAIVIPTINCLKYLKLVIGSLPHAGELVLVIDQASTDGTGAWLAEQEDLLTLTQTRNIGVAPAWNLGLVSAFAAGATHVAVLNHDIILAPTALERLTGWVDRGLGLATVKPVPEMLSHIHPETGIDPRVWGAIPRQSWLSRPGDFCGFMVTRRAVDEVGWFDERYQVAYCEDLDFEMRLLERGLPHGMCHDALVYHYGSRAVWEGGVNNGESFRSNVAYFERKWGLHHEHARRLIASMGPPTVSSGSA